MTLPGSNSTRFGFSTTRLPRTSSFWSCKHAAHGVVKILRIGGGRTMVTTAGRGAGRRPHPASAIVAERAGHEFAAINR